MNIKKGLSMTGNKISEEALKVYNENKIKLSKINIKRNKTKEEEEEAKELFKTMQDIKLYGRY